MCGVKSWEEKKQFFLSTLLDVKNKHRYLHSLLEKRAPNNLFEEEKKFIEMVKTKRHK